jgi:hypothetical protein
MRDPQFRRDLAADNEATRAGECDLGIRKQLVRQTGKEGADKISRQPGFKGHRE